MSAADDLLRTIARFGVLTAEQAVRGAGSGAVADLRALRRRGLVTAVARWPGRGGDRAHRLTARGRAAARALGWAAQPARRDRMDESLAAVDLARCLEAEGAGRWRTWAEWKAVGAAGAMRARRRVRLARAAVRLSAAAERSAPPRRAGVGAAPCGVWEDRDGQPWPVWVLLTHRGPAALRRSTCVALRPPFRGGLAFVWPPLVQAARSDNLPLDVMPLSPPHLHGRAPLRAGWWRGAGDHPSPEPNAAMTQTVVRHLDRFGLATTAQVARDAGVSPRTARSALTQLRAAGLTRVVPCPTEAAQVWTATARGLARVGARERLLAERPRAVRHTLRLGDLAHDLCSRYGGTWESERDLAAEIGNPYSRDALPPPDGRLTLPDGTRACVQLQLTPGDIPAQYAAAHAWCARGGCHAVWFVCVPHEAAAYRRALRPGDVGVLRVMDWVATDGRAARGVRGRGASKGRGRTARRGD